MDQSSDGLDEWMHACMDGVMDRCTSVSVFGYVLAVHFQQHTKAYQILNRF